MKRAAFLDVDKALILNTKRNKSDNGVPKYIINTELLEQLKSKGVNDIFLFTNMDLSDLDNLGDQNYITRKELTDILTLAGFKVHKVITPQDPGYKKGIGAAYEDIYLPAFEKKKKDPTYSRELYNKDKNAFLTPLKDLQEEREKLITEHNLTMPAAQKRMMFEYFLKEKNNHPELKYLESIAYADDDKSCLDAINDVPSDLKVETIQIEPDQVTNALEKEALDKSPSESIMIFNAKIGQKPEIDTYIEQIQKKKLPDEQQNFLIALKINHFNLGTLPEYKKMQGESPLFKKIDALLRDNDAQKGPHVAFHNQYKIVLNLAINHFEQAVAENRTTEIVTREFEQLRAISNGIDDNKFNVRDMQEAFTKLGSLEQNKYEKVTTIAEKGKEIIQSIASEVTRSRQQAQENMKEMKSSLPLLTDFMELTRKILSLYSQSTYGASMDKMLQDIDRVFTNIVTYYTSDAAQQNTHGDNIKYVSEQIKELAKNLEGNLPQKGLSLMFAPAAEVAEKFVRQFNQNHQTEPAIKPTL